MGLYFITQTASHDTLRVAVCANCPEILCGRMGILVTSTTGSSLINHMLVVHLVCGEPMTLGAKIRRRLGRQEIVAIGALLTLVVSGG